MIKNHALYFTFNGPVAGREPQAMETLNLWRDYWNKKQAAGEIAGFDTVMFASTGNPHREIGFALVTGDRSKLQDLRWSDEAFLTLHTQMMTTFGGYCCIDGYTGVSFDQHLARVNKLMKK